MKAYSVALRQKVIDAQTQKDGTQRQLAKRFRVSLSFVQNLLKRYRIDGTVEPREHGGGQPAKLSLEQELEARREKLAECEALAASTLEAPVASREQKMHRLVVELVTRREQTYLNWLHDAIETLQS